MSLFIFLPIDYLFKPFIFGFCFNETLKPLNEMWKIKNLGTFSDAPLSKLQNRKVARSISQRR